MYSIASIDYRLQQDRHVTVKSESKSLESWNLCKITSRHVLLLSNKLAVSRCSVAHSVTCVHAPGLVLSEALAFLHCRLWP